MNDGPSSDAQPTNGRTTEKKRPPAVVTVRFTTLPRREDAGSGYSHLNGAGRTSVNPK